MKVVAPIIARMASRRLPGKALLELAGKTCLEHVADRVRMCETVDEVALFTTWEPSDDPLEEAGKALGLPVFRGSVSPTERVVAGLREFQADIYVHGAYCDSPLVYWQWLDDMLKAMLDAEADYVHVHNPNHKPSVIGMTHILHPYTTGGLLQILWGARAGGEDLLEHINLVLDRDPRAFNVLFYEMPREFYDWRPYRLKLDYHEDYTLLRSLFQVMYKGEPLDNWEVSRFLDANLPLARTNAYLQDMPINIKDEWVLGRWRGEMLRSRRPLGSSEVWCNSGSCYLGYAQEEPGALGAPAERLHLPDGTVVEGDADLQCLCGAGRHWYWDAEALKDLEGRKWRRVT
jgi:spore coat polysaccharide biosynthesis protein SpsF (cytidylyltransferase family)